ncbi:MAG: nuclear transport factor 2 family protein [Candidatus Acidiferrales bacterium]
MRLSLVRGVGLLVLLAACGGAPALAQGPAEESRPALDKILHDYISLYTRATLDQWKTLFHPSLTVAHAAADGSIRVRNLEEFFAAQKYTFESGRAISERLENLRVDTGRRLARVTADFIFVDQGQERPGKLGLHLVEGKDGWKIVALVFSYNEGR